MTREFERDSKMPLMAILIGVMVSCFATWYAIHFAWEL